MYQQIRRAFVASLLTVTCLVAFAQKTVTGTVKDANGEPMIGVTVATGSGTGAVTDMDGNFTIPNASPSTVLNVSYVGYKSQTVKVGNSNTLNIVLQEDNTTLEDVVVIGYGTMKRRDLTGAVASVTGETLAKNPVSNIAQALQGQLPGVSVISQESLTSCIPSPWHRLPVQRWDWAPQVSALHCSTTWWKTPTTPWRISPTSLVRRLRRLSTD